MGVGVGLTGQTYALPTCYRPGEPVTMQELAVFSLRAAVRLHQIRLREQPGESSNDGVSGAAAPRKSVP